MTPVQYARDIVVPTVIEVRQKRWDRRRAYLACLVTYHLADFVVVELGLSSPEDVRNSVGISDEFLAVEAINIEAKHVAATRSVRARNIGLRAGRERIWFPSFTGIARAGSTILGDKKGGVKVKIGNRGVDAFVSVCTVLQGFRAAYPSLFADVNWEGLLSR